MNEYVEKILKTNKKIVMAITGGGTIAISELLKYGGASNNLLSAYVPYDQKTLDLYLGYVRPQDFKYCSLDASKLMARFAWQSISQHIYQHNFEKHESLVAVGASCSLAKNGPERPDREHQAFISIKTHDWMRSWIVHFIRDLVLPPIRVAQEECIGTIILKKLSESCVESFETEEEIQKYHDSWNMYSIKREWEKI